MKLTKMRIVQYMLLFAHQINFGLCILHPDGYDYEECAPEKKKCEFWLVVQEHLTMIYEKNLVYAHKGNLYLYNEHHSNFTTHVCLDDWPVRRNYLFLTAIHFDEICYICELCVVQQLI